MASGEQSHEALLKSQDLEGDDDRFWKPCRRHAGGGTTTYFRQPPGARGAWQAGGGRKSCAPCVDEAKGRVETVRPVQLIGRTAQVDIDDSRKTPNLLLKPHNPKAPARGDNSQRCSCRSDRAGYSRAAPCRADSVLWSFAEAEVAVDRSSRFGQNVDGSSIRIRFWRESSAFRSFK